MSSIKRGLMNLILLKFILLNHIINGLNKTPTCYFRVKKTILQQRHIKSIKCNEAIHCYFRDSKFAIKSHR